MDYRHQFTLGFTENPSRMATLSTSEAITSHPNVIDKLPSSWEILSFDTHVLGVKTARLTASLPGSRLQTIIEECVAEDTELLYWTPESGSLSATYIENAPGYAVAQII